jgi:hypothetical protein
MRKSIAIFSIFLFLSFSTNTIYTFAQPKSFSQGVYKVKDLGLMPNTSYDVQNVSPNSDSFIIIFDSTLRIQQSLHVVPDSSKYLLLPFQYDYLIVIIGNGKLVFS